MRQRYNKEESLNRILRTLQGSSVATDVPGTVQGEILSDSEALSDITELIDGSLPSQNVVTPLAFLHYGHMYAHNVTGTVDIITQDVFATLTGSVSAGLLKDFTFADNSHLVCGFAGTYFISWSQSVFSASANQEVEASIMINTTPQSGSSAHAEATGANKPHALSGSMIVKLANGDVIYFCVANHTGTTNLVVQHANMTVQWAAPY
jgi:hypothetical protein